MPDISALGLLALILGALLAGFSKTAIAGVTTISVALFAAVLPARQSTGVLLVLLLCGDIVAVYIYRRAAAWRVLAHLAPPVLAGIVAGTWFLDHMSNTAMRRALGIILLVLSLMQLTRLFRARRGTASGTSPTLPPTAGQHTPTAVTGIAATYRGPLQRAMTLLYGVAAGFTTMVANAGGPVMNLYLLSQRFDKVRFLGTTAWFFFGVNLVKLPFSMGLGLISAQSLKLDAVLVPAVWCGCALGRWCIKRINQRTFELLILGFTMVSCVYLLIS